MHEASRANSAPVGRSGANRGWTIAGLAVCAVMALGGCSSSIPPGGPSVILRRAVQVRELPGSARIGVDPPGCDHGRLGGQAG